MISTKIEMTSFREKKTKIFIYIPQKNLDERCLQKANKLKCSQFRFTKVASF